MSTPILCGRATISFGCSAPCDSGNRASPRLVVLQELRNRPCSQLSSAECRLRDGLEAKLQTAYSAHTKPGFLFPLLSLHCRCEIRHTAPLQASETSHIRHLSAHHPARAGLSFEPIKVGIPPRVLLIVSGFHVAAHLGTITQYAERRPEDSVKVLLMQVLEDGPVVFSEDFRGEADLQLGVRMPADG